MREQYIIKIILTSALTFIIAMLLGSIALSQVAKEANEIARDGRFIAYDDDTVKTTETGLLWAANDDGKGMDKQNAYLL